MNKALDKSHDAGGDGRTGVGTGVGTGTGISRGTSRGTDARRLDWRRKMSNNVAYALLVYTALQIFVTTAVMAETGYSVLPYFALVILIAAIIPACRMFERRWRDIGDEAAADLSLARSFRRHQIALWLMAIGLPFIITGLIKLGIRLL